MAEVSTTVQSPDEERAAERTKLDEVSQCLGLLDMLQGALAGTATRQQLAEAEGRRCVVVVTGLKHHEQAYFFKVQESRIRLTPPFKDYTTHVAAPLDVVLRVLKNVIAGNAHAFSEELARGSAKMVSTNRKFHDMWVFMEGFKRLATIIQRYRTDQGTV